jgi:hypothetical protein
MALRLLYLVFRRLAGWLALLARRPGSRRVRGWVMVRPAGRESVRQDNHERPYRDLVLRWPIARNDKSELPLSLGGRIRRRGGWSGSPVPPVSGMTFGF